MGRATGDGQERRAGAAMIHVALADPQSVTRDGLRLVIEREDGLWVGGTFSTGERLCSACESGSPPDVLIIESQLPDGTGAEWTARIKRSHPSIRVVILTSSHADSDLLLSLEAGVDGFLYKEDSAESVVRAVREVLRGNLFISPLAARRMRDLTLNESGDALSSRELEVLVALHDGLNTEEIGQRLCIAESTVKTHITGIYRKLGAHNRVGASREAERRGLVSPD